MMLLWLISCWAALLVGFLLGCAWHAHWDEVAALERGDAQLGTDPACRTDTPPPTTLILHK